MGYADDQIGIVTLDRPHARNAINPELAAAVEAAMDDLEGDDAIRVIVITATPPVFCAGADLKAVRAGLDAQMHTQRGGFAGLVKRERSKPLIAAVEGGAYAGGLEIVLSCDLVVASHDAMFGLPEVKRSLVAAAGGMFRLGRAIAPAVAMEMILTGDPIGADRAHQLGLVNHLCTPGEAAQAGVALAQRIAANAPDAVRIARVTTQHATRADDATAWRILAAALAEVQDSGDFEEGIDSFIAKRPAAWAQHESQPMDKPMSVDDGRHEVG